MGWLDKLKRSKKAPSYQSDSSLGSDEIENPFQQGGGLEEYEFTESALDSDLDTVNGEQGDVSDPELIAADKKDSRFSVLVNSLPKINVGGGGYQLLAFQAGSFGLRGALIRNTRHSTILTAVVESRNVDFTRAIAEVIEKLKLQHSRLPKQAILVTPSVISSVVELPVSPLRPRSDEEMQELIRWELEGTLTQQNKHWLIGSMLVERGYLTPSQRDELVEELKIRQSQGGQDGLIRFGDLAVQLRYITQEQLEECFVLQGKLIAVDDELAYGWQAEEPQLDQGLSDEVLLSAEEDGDSSHKWLVCGISKSVRRRWVGAFNLNGIKVQAFYPSIGSGFAALAQRSSDACQALLEVHQEQLAFITGTETSIEEIRVAERSQGSIRRDELQDLFGVLPKDLQTVHINSDDEDLEELIFTLSTVVDKDVKPLELEFSELIQQDSVAANTLLGLMGAADHFLGHVPSSRLSWIASKDKEASALKKILTPRVLGGTAAFFIIASMLGFLGWMHWNMWQQTERLNDLEARFEKESKLKDQFKSIEGEQDRLKADIAAVHSEIEANTLLLDNLSQEKVREKALTSLLLKSLSVVTPSSVYLENLTHAGGQVSLKAFALDNTEGQAFINALNKLLRPAKYEVKSSDISRTKSGDMPFNIMITIGTTQIDDGVVDR